MDNKLGEFLSLRRNGESLRSFSDKLGISHAYLKTLEEGVDPRNGKVVTPSIKALKSISIGLGVELSELLNLAGFGRGDSTFDYETETNSTNYYPSDIIPYAPTGNIPILGQIPAGIAVLAVEDIEGYLAVNVHNPEECFALRVKGDSMLNAGISPGDLVVIRMQQCAENGQIVACRINGDEATLKRFKQQGETIVLLPENPKYEPIIVPCSEFSSGYASIIGVALQVVRML